MNRRSTTKVMGAPLLTRPATEGSELHRIVRTDLDQQPQDRDKSFARDGC